MSVTEPPTEQGVVVLLDRLGTKEEFQNDTNMAITEW